MDYLPHGVLMDNLTRGVVSEEVKINKTVYLVKHGQINDDPRNNNTVKFNKLY